jgi:HSP20 family molecular chaperone IbpA
MNMTDDYADDNDEIKKIIEALFKGVFSSLIGQPLDAALNSSEEIKLPHFEAVEDGKKISLLVEMPGAIEEDIAFSVVDDFGHKYLNISTVDSLLGEKYKVSITLPSIIKKAVKDHFSNGVLELTLM